MTAIPDTTADLGVMKAHRETAKARRALIAAIDLMKHDVLAETGTPLMGDNIVRRGMEKIDAARDAYARAAWTEHCAKNGWTE